jgi:hypothetical protein
MFRIPLRDSLLGLFLILALSSSASAAPIPWGGFFGEEGRGVLHLLQGVFPGGLHSKSGCGISPDGKPLCAPKRGCSINPDGQPVCAPAITPKLGCGINPDGLTICTP